MNKSAVLLNCNSASNWHEMRNLFFLEKISPICQSAELAHRMVKVNQACQKHQTTHLDFSTLRKHAYSNILTILPPKIKIFQVKSSDILYISAQNIDCGTR